MVYAVASIAFLSFTVWAHHMFTTGLGPIATSFFAASTMLIAVPTGVKIFNWISTVYGGSLSLKPPALFSLGFVAMFTIGGLSGVMHASPPVDTQHQDTYFVVAHFHYVLFGGSIFGLFGGIYYWFPKVSGRLLNEGLGKLHFWLMFIGFNLTFGPQHFLGVDGMPRRIFTYPAEMGWGPWNLVSTMGAYILGIATLVFIYNAIKTLRNGEPAGGDPWDGRTLEWTTSSPPAHYNYAVLPTVHSRDPFWEEKHPHLAEHGTTPAGTSHSAVASAQAHHGESADEHGHGGIHLPDPSYWPLVSAIGIFITGFGLLFSFPLIPVGLIVVLVSVYGWSLEPVNG
jgi:cytochrome c oxidase subunit 1